MSILGEDLCWWRKYTETDWVRSIERPTEEWIESLEYLKPKGTCSVTVGIGPSPTLKQLLSVHLSVRVCMAGDTCNGQMDSGMTGETKHVTQNLCSFRGMSSWRWGEVITDIRSKVVSCNTYKLVSIV